MKLWRRDVTEILNSWCCPGRTFILNSLLRPSYIHGHDGHIVYSIKQFQIFPRRLRVKFVGKYEEYGDWFWSVFGWKVIARWGQGSSSYIYQRSFVLNGLPWLKEPRAGVRARLCPDASIRSKFIFETQVSRINLSNRPNMNCHASKNWWTRTVFKYYSEN